MRSAPVIGIAVCFAVAYAMLAGAGWTAATGGTSGGGVVDSVSDQANKSEIKGEGNPGQSDDGDIVGFIINAGRNLDDIVALGLTIGTSLGNLGFPRWFTQPIGWAIQIVLSVGFAQFVANRVLR